MIGDNFLLDLNSVQTVEPLPVRYATHFSALGDQTHTPYPLPE